MQNDFKTYYETKCSDKTAFRKDLIKAGPITKQTFYRLLSKGIGKKSKLGTVINALMVKWGK